MPPSVKVARSQLQPDSNVSVTLIEELRSMVLSFSAELTAQEYRVTSLTEKVIKLEAKIYSNDKQTGLEDEITFIEMENLFTLQTQVDEIDQRIKQLESNDSTAQIWKPPVTSFNPPPIDFTRLKKEVSTISEQVKVIQNRDSNSNLVLYGVPETEKSNKELSATVARVAIDLLHIQFTYSGISNSRIGDRNITSKRPRPVRIHFHDPSDRNDF